MIEAVFANNNAKPPLKGVFLSDLCGGDAKESQKFKIMNCYYKKDIFMGWRPPCEFF